MKWPVLLLLLLLGAVAPVHAQTGKIAGYVRDADTGDPLPGVNVVLEGTLRGSATDIDGYYVILNVPPGEYAVTASFLGYQPVTKTGVEVNTGRTTELDFTLAVATVELGEEVIVSAERPVIDPERIASSEIIQLDEVTVSPGVYDLADVLDLTVDVTDGHFRGGRTGEEIYLLNGINIINPINNSRAFQPSAMGIEEVEVITGGFPAEYGNAQSGVVNIALREGNAHRWEGEASVRLRAPGRKHFGPGVFDADAHAYIQAFDSVEEWAGDSGEGEYYNFIGYGFGNIYGADSVQAARIAYELWRQAREELNSTYGQGIDSDVQVALGGPLTSWARTFLATRFESTWPVFPYDRPLESQQLLGNVTFGLGGGTSLRLAGAYSYAEELQASSSFWNWLWDRAIGLAPVQERTFALGTRFSYAVSDRTFYEANLTALRTHTRQGATVLDPNRYREDAADAGVWRYFNPPDQFRVGYMENDFLNERTWTWALDAAYNSQVTNNHLVKAGLQARLYDINVRNRRNLSSPSDAQDERFHVNPVDLSLFVQDKLEYSGIIASIGLRLDAYNQNTEYYTNQFAPYLNPNFDPKKPPVGDNAYLSPDLAARDRTPWVVRLQPRFGASFPVFVGTVFHLNYGAFLQRPSFERTLASRIQRSNSNAIIRFGNPRLKPEETKMYEVGVAQALPAGFTLDVSGYYKDVKNLVQLAFFRLREGLPYETFVNRDYADIRGFRVSLVRRSGPVRGFVRYHYSIATGKTSSAFDAPPTFTLLESGEVDVSGGALNLNDVLLDFDRTHNLLVQLTLSTPSNFGFEIAGFNPLGGLNLSVKSRMLSGRPYTYAGEGTGLEGVLLANRRSPAEYQTDLKINRRFEGLVGGADLVLFAEVINLFNNRHYDYNYVFGDPLLIRSYEGDADEPIELIIPPNGSFTANQEWRIYDNLPRSFYVGVNLDF
ncbi:carboxypeptidase regulatory-like domain-containing protein [Rhodocaloribacter litoris]|uniref:TonB-dependent receptor n=1 Tax=Rhodocaloribacter litoris TaxID=2558931 RepID=UPI0014229934|nr:TonB-dependent receptor [Rhodocaloribacter litoris]QXD14089.1 carboxypeptidase regulatory-like domain-containing protein [Rhodocaloribacter litoris]